MLCRYIAISPIANATRKTQLAKKPAATEANTVEATISPNVVPIAVGKPTARRSSVFAGGTEACVAIIAPSSAPSLRCTDQPGANRLRITAA